MPVQDCLPKFCVLACAGFLLVVPAGPSAASVLAPLSPQQDGRVRASGVLNLANDDGRAIRAGTNGGDVEFRGFLTFDISGATAEITDAQLNLDLEVILNSPNTYDLIGIAGLAGNGINTSNGNVNNGAAFFAAAGTELSTNNAAATSELQFDVTAFLESRRIAGDTYVGFRIDENSPSLDGTADLLQFTDSTDPITQGNQPTLNITVAPIPEPASVALLTTGGLILAGRRRRA